MFKDFKTHLPKGFIGHKKSTEYGESLYIFKEDGSGLVRLEDDDDVKGDFWIMELSVSVGCREEGLGTILMNIAENIYGDVNVINKTKIRSRGLTYSGNFTLNFEYSLKSLKCVNPRVAMMDILSNFLILTGNYGSFWGGETRFYGQRSIAPQFGDPEKLRKGDFKGYFNSLISDVKSGFDNISNANGGSGSLWDGIKNLASGALQSLLGNLLGGNVGVAGSAQAPVALLSGEPTGYWHVTVGNPLDPIAMMGNMAVTKTTVQFNDVLGYDDFPTEIKFTVELQHCMPRDNAAIENMFNGAKGRFYAFTDSGVLKSFTTIDNMAAFQPRTDEQHNQQVNIDFDSNSRPIAINKLKIIGANLGK